MRKPPRAPKAALEVDLEVAHESLDHVGPQPVVFGEPVAFGDGQSSTKYMFGVTRDDHLVLDAALRKAADRRGAESNQHVGPIGCVTLEVPP